MKQFNGLPRPRERVYLEPKRSKHLRALMRLSVPIAAVMILFALLFTTALLPVLVFLLLLGTVAVSPLFSEL